jgi:hypothetical protein
LVEWENIENDIITDTGEHTFSLKMKNLGFNEIFKLKFLEVREKIALVGVFGHAKDLGRDRILGNILLYTGEPYIHQYPFYLGVAYSEPTDVRRKEPKLIYEDEHVRLFRAGVGTIDYFFAYRNRMPMHDEIGRSDGAAYKKILDIWKL